MTSKKNLALERRIQAYPPPALYNKVVAFSERQGKSVSSIITDALRQYIEKESTRK